jgi:hypothetical protein
MRPVFWLGLAGCMLASTPALAVTPLVIFNATSRPVTLYLDGIETCAMGPAAEDGSSDTSCILRVDDGDHTVDAEMDDGTRYTMEYDAPDDARRAIVDAEGLHPWAPDD